MPREVENIYTHNEPTGQKIEQKQPGIFSQKQAAPDPRLAQTMSEIGEAGRRLRILEERYSNIRKKTQVTDQNMLMIQKNLTREIKTIDEQLNDLQRSLDNMNSEIRQIFQEIRNFAKSEDLNVLKRYLDMWQPLKFLTKKEAENIVREMLLKNRNI